MSKTFNQLLIEDVLESDNKEFFKLVACHNKTRLRWQTGIFFFVIFGYLIQRSVFGNPFPYLWIALGILALFILFNFAKQHLTFIKFFNLTYRVNHLNHVCDCVISGDDEAIKADARCIKSDIDKGIVDSKYLEKLSLDRKHLEEYIDKKYGD
jgi:hypothetical protein